MLRGIVMVVFGVVLLAVLEPVPGNAAPWEVEAEIEFREDGVVYEVELGKGLLERLVVLPAGEGEGGGADRSEARMAFPTEVRDALAEDIGEVNRFLINGVVVAPELRRFEFVEEDVSDDGEAKPGTTRVKMEVFYPVEEYLESVTFSWGMLPERYFETKAAAELIEYLDDGDRAAAVRLIVLGQQVMTLGMRKGANEISWTRAAGALVVVDDEDEGGEDGGGGFLGAHGRVWLVIVLAVLIVLRLAMKQVRGR